MSLPAYTHILSMPPIVQRFFVIVHYIHIRMVTLIIEGSVFSWSYVYIFGIHDNRLLWSCRNTLVVTTITNVFMISMIVRISLWYPRRPQLARFLWWYVYTYGIHGNSFMVHKTSEGSGIFAIQRSHFWYRYMIADVVEFFAIAYLHWRYPWQLPFT